MGDGLTGGWRKLHDERVRDFCCSLGSYCWGGQVTQHEIGWSCDTH
jgi:hypothetical protein